MSNRVIQKRLRWAFTFIALTISILYGLLVYNAMKYTEDDILNQRLKLEAQYYIQQYQANKNTARLPVSIGLSSYLSSSPDLPDILKAQPPGCRELHREELHVGVFHIPGSNELLYLSLSELESSHFEKEQPYLFLLLIAVGLSITLVGLAIGLLFSRMISKPIILLTEDVENDRRDSLAPFYGADRNDEVGALSRAFSSLVLRLQEFLAREKQFTRYASHELRTPISLIKNAVAILRLPKQDDSRSLRNLGRIESATVEIESLIDTFLALAREKKAVREEVDLIDVLNKNLDRNQLVNEYKKININIKVEGELGQIFADREYVDILVDNIVRNIFMHGSKDAQITVTAATVLFENGISETQPVENKIPRESYGMEIIEKLSEKCGFELSFGVSNQRYSLKLTLTDQVFLKN